MTIVGCLMFCQCITNRILFDNWPYVKLSNEVFPVLVDIVSTISNDISPVRLDRPCILGLLLFSCSAFSLSSQHQPDHPNSRSYLPQPITRALPCYNDGDFSFCFEKFLDMATTFRCSSHNPLSSYTFSRVSYAKPVISTSRQVIFLNVLHRNFRGFADSRSLPHRLGDRHKLRGAVRHYTNSKINPVSQSSPLLKLKDNNDNMAGKSKVTRIPSSGTILVIGRTIRISSK